MMFFSSHGETTIANSGTGYVYPFGEPPIDHETSQTADEAFAIVPISGTFKALRVRNAVGTMDAGEEVTYTLQVCSGGDMVSGCTWTDTALSVTATSSGQTFTTTTDVSVTAGDVFTLEITEGADGPDSGAAETWNWTFEFEANDSTTSFITGTTQNSANTRDNFPPVGPADLAQTTPFPKWPVPDSFDVEAVYCSAVADVASDWNYYLCDGGTGSASECDGAGTLIATCTMSSGTSQCNSTTGLPTTITTSTELFWRTGTNFTAFGVTCGIELSNSSSRWASGSCRPTYTGGAGDNEGSMGSNGTTPGSSVYVCNPTIAQETCYASFISEATIIQSYALSNTAPAGAGESWDIGVLDDATLTAQNCSMGASATTCSDADDVTIAADSDVTFRYSAVGGTMDSANFCNSHLWDSL